MTAANNLALAVTVLSILASALEVACYFMFNKIVREKYEVYLRYI